MPRDTRQPWHHFTVRMQDGSEQRVGADGVLVMDDWVVFYLSVRDEDGGAIVPAHRQRIAWFNRDVVSSFQKLPREEKE